MSNPNIQRITVNAKPRVLSAQWTIELTEEQTYAKSKTVEEELSELLSDSIRREIDWEFLVKMHVGGGWTEVLIATPKEPEEVHTWLKANALGKFAGHWDFHHVVFEKSEDAAWFKLRWS